MKPDVISLQAELVAEGSETTGTENLETAGAAVDDYGRNLRVLDYEKRYLIPR